MQIKTRGNRALADVCCRQIFSWSLHVFNIYSKINLFLIEISLLAYGSSSHSCAKIINDRFDALAS